MVGLTWHHTQDVNIFEDGADVFPYKCPTMLTVVQLAQDVNKLVQRNFTKKYFKKIGQVGLNLLFSKSYHIQWKICTKFALVQNPYTGQM